MNEPPTLLLGQAFADMLRQIVKDELKAARSQNQSVEDRLLDVNEASKILSVSPDWLYRHRGKLPFTHRLGPKMLRFSYQGIQKYLASRK